MSCDSEADELILLLIQARRSPKADPLASRSHMAQYANRSICLLLARPSNQAPYARWSGSLRCRRSGARLATSESTFSGSGGDLGRRDTRTNFHADGVRNRRIRGGAGVLECRSSSATTSSDSGRNRKPPLEGSLEGHSRSSRD